jgi:hypothetical protein
MPCQPVSGGKRRSRLGLAVAAAVITCLTAGIASLPNAPGGTPRRPGEPPEDPVNPTLLQVGSGTLPQR